MGSEVGHYFVYRAFTSWPIETPLVHLISYVGAQFSIEVKNWELKRDIDMKKQRTDTFFTEFIKGKVLGCSFSMGYGEFMIVEL